PPPRSPARPRPQSRRSAPRPHPPAQHSSRIRRHRVAPAAAPLLGRGHGWRPSQPPLDRATPPCSHFKDDDCERPAQARRRPGAGNKDRNGGSDGTRTRGLRRDRPTNCPENPKTAPTFRVSETGKKTTSVGTLLSPRRRP